MTTDEITETGILRTRTVISTINIYTLGTTIVQMGVIETHFSAAPPFLLLSYVGSLFPGVSIRLLVADKNGFVVFGNLITLKNCLRLIDSKRNMRK